MGYLSLVVVILSLFLVSCSGSDVGTDGGSGGPVEDDDALSTASGCLGVFNPDQMLDFHLNLSANDWSSLQADTTFSVYFAAKFHCNDMEPIDVAVRRKRSGDAVKVGLKVDINRTARGQTWFSLKKLNLENGASRRDPSADVGNLITEYLGWRLMVLSGAISSRAAFANVYINGEFLGVYVNIEAVDKRFLAYRFGDSSGWLFKRSGGDNDGYKTNELVPNPHAAYFCFWEPIPCAPPTPTELAADLPTLLDITQLLKMSAVNALMANTDSPLFDNNNYYFYDGPGGRAYLPWDLDTTMNKGYDVFTGAGVGGLTTVYTDVLFTAWENDYDQILTDLLAQPLALSAIEGEFDRVESVAVSALDSDTRITGNSTTTISDLRAWWQTQHAAVQAQVDTH